MLIAFSFSQQSVRILLLQLFAYTSTDIEATASFVCYLRVNNGRRQLEFHLQRSGKVHGELGFNSSHIAVAFRYFRIALDGTYIFDAGIERHIGRRASSLLHDCPRSLQQWMSRLGVRGNITNE